MPSSLRAELLPSTLAVIEPLFRLPVGVPGGGRSGPPPPPPPAPPRPLTPAGLPRRVLGSVERQFALMGLEAGTPGAPRAEIQHGAASAGRIAGPGSITRTIFEPALHSTARQDPPPRFRSEPVFTFSTSQQRSPRGYPRLVDRHHIAAFNAPATPAYGYAPA